MTAIVDTLDQLTPEWLTDALRASGTLPEDAAVHEATTSLIGTGQLGLVGLVELSYDGDAGATPPRIIVKLPSADAGSRQMGSMMGIYESEVRFYDEIAPTLGDVVPDVYWGDVEASSGRFTLLIEDLTQTATVGDMVDGGTIEQANLAIGALPQIQTPLWDDPRLREKTWLGIAKTEMLFGAVEPMIDTFAERFGPRLAPAHVDLARALVPKAAGSAKRLWQPPFVIAHGDYRLDNMMFGDDGSAAPPLTVIDWQAVRSGPPLLDAAIFLGSCMTVEERHANQERLLRDYHARIVDAGVKDFSYDDVLQSLRISSLYPFLICVAVAVTLQQTERGDQMWAQLFTNSAEIVVDTDASALLV